MALLKSASRFLSWAALAVSAALYVLAHRGTLGVDLSIAYREAPWPPLAALAPGGGLAPWLVAGGGIVGGWILASLLPVPLPAGVRLGIGAFASLVLPAHALELLSWAGDRPLFRPWCWAVAVWLLVGLLAALRKRRPSPAPGCAEPREIEGPDPLRPWLLATTVVVALVYVESIGRTIRHGPRAWDAHSYHMPVPLQWIHLESLTEPLARQVIYGHLGLEKFANPGNGHLLMTLPLLLGWDLVACLVQLPFALLGAWAVASMARGAGASRGASTLAALAFAAAPIVANQAAVPILDLATGALTLAAVAILLACADAPEMPGPSLLLAGLALGLGLGTKTTAWSHLPLVVLALLTSGWLRRPPLRPVLSMLQVFALAAALPCAFWYARSAVLFENPIYPIGIRLLGVPLVKGTTAELMSGYWEQQMGISQRWGWLLFPFRDPAYFEDTGFGPLLVCLGALGLGAGLVDLAGGLRDRRLTPPRRLSLLLVLALVVFWFAAARTPRFNLPLLGLVAAVAAPAVDALGGGLRRRVVGVFALAAVLLTLQLSVSYHGWDLGPPENHAWELVKDFPGAGGFGIPPAVDELSPSVILNDTVPETTSQASNYYLFGRDHRHMVYDHRDLTPKEPGEFVSSLRGLGVHYVFLRISKRVSPPARYDTSALEPAFRWEGEEFRSTLYRVAAKKQ